MDLEALARLIGSPPRRTAPVDWAAVQKILGLRLPADFVAFADAYGPIDLGEFVWVWSPAAGPVPLWYDTHRMLRAWRDEDPSGHPYTFWPEPGGLLMWGRSRAAHHFFWDTAASTDPRRWPTVVYSYLKPASHPGMYAASGPVWHRLDRPMIDVLAALVGDGPPLGLDLDPLPGRYVPTEPSDPSTEPLPRPAAASPDAVERIIHAIGTPAPVIPADWSGDRLPSDYRALIDRIGPGTLDRRLILHAPGGPSGYDLGAEHTRTAPTVASRPRYTPNRADCGCGAGSPPAKPAGGCRPGTTATAGRW